MFTHHKKHDIAFIYKEIFASLKEEKSVKTNKIIFLVDFLSVS